MRRAVFALLLVACSASKTEAIEDANSELGKSADVSGSWVNTCAVVGGGAKCWGGNYDGQLGNNGSIDSFAPVDVIGLTRGVSKIAIGGSAACALSVTGGVSCWGLNTNGQLGSGTTALRHRTAVPVVGLSRGVNEIVLGSDHGCARIGSRVKCWGGNEVGQLGDGTKTMSRVPVDVIGLDDDVTALSSSGSHTCALERSGTVKCWGRGERGQLGNGSIDDRFLPTAMTLSAKATFVSAGHEHTCVALETGKVVCAGRNDLGQLGDGTLEDAASPHPVLLAESAVSVAAGGYHSCAITNAGRAHCWGLGLSGQLGDGSEVQSALSAVQVVGLTNPKKLALGLYHSCAIDEADRIQCWGLNGYAGAAGVDPNITFTLLTPTLL